MAKGILDFINMVMKEGWRCLQDAGCLHLERLHQCFHRMCVCMQACWRPSWKLFLLHLVYNTILAKFGEFFLPFKTTASLLALGHSRDTMLGLAACRGLLESVRLSLEQQPNPSEDGLERRKESLRLLVNCWREPALRPLAFISHWFKEHFHVYYFCMWDMP